MAIAERKGECEVATHLSETTESNDGSSDDEGRTGDECDGDALRRVVGPDDSGYDVVCARWDIQSTGEDQSHLSEGEGPIRHLYWINIDAQNIVRYILTLHQSGIMGIMMPSYQPMVRWALVSVLFCSSGEGGRVGGISERS
jgi:hypothetical protein